jgi:hypothetical protein
MTTNRSTLLLQCPLLVNNVLNFANAVVDAATKGLKAISL